MKVEIGDLVQEKCHDGISFGIVQEFIEDDAKPGIIRLCTTDNQHLVWCTYDWALKFNYGKMTLAEANEKYPERLI